jgi:hypothetical protein
VRNGHCDEAFTSTETVNPPVRCNEDIIQTMLGFKDGIVD